MKKIAVIGSGNMGSKIASIISTKTEVLLFDIPSKDSNLKNQISIDAIENLKKIKPIAYFSEKFLNKIIPCDLETNLEMLKSCDLVIEAIVEDINIKKSLYNNISKYLKKDAIIASNTSTFCLKELKNGVNFKNIIITHFFNPPIQMKLLELIVDEDIDSSLYSKIKHFLEFDLGRAVVKCKDTPGFIANRIGCFMLACSLHYANLYKINYCYIDQIFHNFFGFPKTGIFGLYDLIGIDTVNLINKSLLNSLDKSDRFHSFGKSDFLNRLIEQKKIGNKSENGGFYRNINGKKYVLHDTEKYMQTSDFILYKSVEEIIEDDSFIGLCVKDIASEVINYASSLIGVICEEVGEVDEAMRLGYGLKYGLFELYNKSLAFNFIKYWLAKQDIEISDYIKNKEYENLNEKDFDFRILKNINNNEILLKNESARLIKIRDRLCIEFTSKMNSLNHDIFNLIIRSIDYAETKNLPLFIYSDFKHFSAGGDLGFFYEKAINKEFDKILDFIKLGQKSNMKMKYAKIPIICFAKGFAIGGGAEMLLHCHKIIASSTLCAGLVEAKLGLIPAWGGLKEMFIRGLENNKLEPAIQNILEGYKSFSAYDFGEKYLIDNMEIYMSDDDLFYQNFTMPKIEDKRLDFKKTLISYSKKVELSYENDKRDKKDSSYNNLEVRIIDPQKELIVSHINSFLENCFSNKSDISEEDILVAEQEIFMNLIKTNESVEKLKKFSGSSN